MPLVRRSGAAFLDRLRHHRRLVSLAAYAAATAGAYVFAFWIAFDLAWPIGYDSVFFGSLLVLLVVRIAAGELWGLATPRWRFVGPTEMRRLVLAVAAGSLVFVPLVTALNLDPAPPTVALLLEPPFTVLLMAGFWLSYRTGFELVTRQDGVEGPARRILIVGAGEAGEALVRQMVRYPNGYRPVAFADDDSDRHGTSIHGVRVFGDTNDLEEMAEATGAEEIVIAIPSADPSDLRRIVDRCEPTGLPFRVLPHIAEVLDGHVSISQLRKVRIEDLLGREPVNLELPELARDLSGQVVLITGAAGSIGSELARQVAHNGPRRLVLLDQSETGLFFTELELRELAPDLELVPVVADIVDATAVERVFTLHAPDRVFHAAAYKHVPMMEANPREALRNNIIGTWRVAEAAGRHQAGKLVLVSTDKAVQPANVMGATKRVAEVVVTELQQKYPETAFGAVRFGNVLGSAGSVIPIFRKQLEAGRPLTVTHPEATRYFMTIPEASQLVLQASLLPELRGRIAMLDMGRPVRILDLARSLLRLSGGGRGREPIVFTGLRPGEKVHEELVAPEELSEATRIPKIQILSPKKERQHDILSRLEGWDRLLEDWCPERVMDEMVEVIPELVGEGAPEGQEIGVVLGPESVDPLPISRRQAEEVKMDHERIYLSPPHLGSLEGSMIADAIASNWVAPVGPDLDAFEREFKTAVGAPGALAVSSGTAALHLALRLAGVERGDTVFISTLTFIGSVNPVLYLGARPYFVDSERQSWNMDPALLAEALETSARRGRLPRAVVLVHLYGQSADIGPIQEACDRYGVTLIEDAAEALGATYRGRTPGTFGKFGIYSFNGNKIITTSGGGMLVSPDPDMMAWARKLATQAREPALHYEHVEMGYNYRLSNLLAALGRAQLGVLEERVAARRWVFDRYRLGLADLPGLEFMPEAAWGRSTRWLTCVTIDPDRFGADRNAVIEALATERIEARPVWKPMHAQPLFEEIGCAGGSVAEDLFERGLCLPSGSALSVEQLERICGIIRRTRRGAAVPRWKPGTTTKVSV